VAVGVSGMAADRDVKDVRPRHRGDKRSADVVVAVTDVFVHVVEDKSLHDAQVNDVTLRHSRVEGNAGVYHLTLFG